MRIRVPELPVAQRTRTLWTRERERGPDGRKQHGQPSLLQNVDDGGGEEGGRRSANFSVGTSLLARLPTLGTKRTGARSQTAANSSVGPSRSGSSRTLLSCVPSSRNVQAAAGRRRYRRIQVQSILSHFLKFCSLSTPEVLVSLPHDCSSKSSEQRSWRSRAQ